MKADGAYQHILKVDEARIFTEGRMPDLANAVIMKEEQNNHSVFIAIALGVKENLNIRLEGEQFKKGDMALKKGAN